LVFDHLFLFIWDFFLLKVPEILGKGLLIVEAELLEGLVFGLLFFLLLLINL